MSHFIEVCKFCGDVITQCRCPDPNKEKRYGVCVNCAAQHVNAADGAKAEPVCSFFGCVDSICAADKESPDRMHFCQSHHDQLAQYVKDNNVPKILGFWIKANGGAKRLAETF